MASDPASLSAQVNKLNLNDSNTPSPKNEPSELVAVVDDLMSQLTTKFNSISAEILAKMDEMSRRLDSLETNIHAGNAAAAAQGEGEEK